MTKRMRIALSVIVSALCGMNASCAGNRTGPRFKMAPVPIPLQSAPRMAVTAEELQQYYVEWQEAHDLFELRRLGEAAHVVEHVEVLRRSLEAHLLTDIGAINTAIAGACWRLSKPKCALEHVERALASRYPCDQLTGSLDNDAHQAFLSVSRNLRDTLASYHAHWASALFARGDIIGARCHGNASVHFAENAEAEGVLGDVFAKHLDTRDRACGAYYKALRYAAEDGSRRTFQAAYDSLGCANIPFPDAFAGFMEDFMRKCDEATDNGIPEPRSSLLPHFELDAHAETRVSQGNFASALPDLIDAESQASRLRAAVSGDADSLLLMEANIAVLDDRLANAHELYQRWLENTSRTAPLEMQSTIAKARSVAQVVSMSLWRQSFDLGVQLYEKAQWREARDAFLKADSYFPDPTDDLALGATYLQLDPGDVNFLKFSFDKTDLELALEAYTDYLTRGAPDASEKVRVVSVIQRITDELSTRRKGTRTFEAWDRLIGELQMQLLFRVVDDLDRWSRQMRDAHSMSMDRQLFGGASGGNRTTTIEWSSPADLLGKSSALAPTPSDLGRSPAGFQPVVVNGFQVATTLSRVAVLPRWTSISVAPGSETGVTLPSQRIQTGTAPTSDLSPNSLTPSIQATQAPQTIPSTQGVEFRTESSRLALVQLKNLKDLISAIRAISVVSPLLPALTNTSPDMFGEWFLQVWREDWLDLEKALGKLPSNQTDLMLRVVDGAIVDLETTPKSNQGVGELEFWLRFRKALRK
jgi:tetratricopeptide (TPR) repeat protein